MITKIDQLNMKDIIQKALGQVLSAVGMSDVAVTISQPTKDGFGDLTTNVALVSFKTLKDKVGTEVHSPNDLATWLASELQTLLIDSKKDSQFSKVESAGNGFINFYFSEQFLWAKSLGLINQKSIQANLKVERAQKVMVEFTDPNPFKELHIGHAYSNAVGETISRGLEAVGHEVKRACYQGDVGMHVAKTLWGWLQLNQSVDELQKLSLNDRVEFLGRAYAHGASAYKDVKSAKGEIQQLNYLVFIVAQDRLKQEKGWEPKVDYRQYLDKIEQFDYEQVKSMYFVGRQWSLDAFEVQYQRLGTKFDEYFFESEVGEVGFEIVKRFLVKGVFAESRGAVIFPGEKYDLHDRVFINSLGLPTYEAKELGLAPTKYERFNYGHSIIITANEIDEYFKVLLKALELVSPELARKTKHISHGMVKLTTGKMSSRTGKIVKAKDLLDEVKNLALISLHQRRGLSDAQKTVVADKIAVSAIKFAFLRSSLGSDITFDPQKAVSFTGESGPYLQYSYVRTQSIWRKLANTVGLDKDLVIDTLLNSKTSKDDVLLDDIEAKEIDILRRLNQYYDVVNRVATEMKPHVLANYLFGLAQDFSQFYEHHQVLGSDFDKNKTGIELVQQLPKATKRRLLLVEMIGQTLKHGLWVLGIAVVEGM